MKKKINIKKYLFNALTYFVYSKILKKKIISKKYIYLKRHLKKNGFINNITHNFYSNLIRFHNIDNYKDSKKNIYIDYFYLTKTNILKKNLFFKNINRLKYINFDYLLKKNENIIHVGASTSFNNFHLKNKFKNKNFYQIDLSKKITIMNKQLFPSKIIKSYSLDLLDIPKLIISKKLQKILLYTSATLTYVPEKKIEIFLKNLKGINKVDLFFNEVSNFDNSDIYSFNNPILFLHNYEKILRRTGWHYDKILSNKNISIARNYT